MSDKAEIYIPAMESPSTIDVKWGDESKAGDVFINANGELFKGTVKLATVIKGRFWHRFVPGRRVHK